MDANDQLKWVINNRRKRRAPRRIGTAIERLANELGEVGQSSGALADAVGGLVDADFRAHCRVTVLKDGQVVVHVDRAALVSVMKRRWQATLNSAVVNRAVLKNAAGAGRKSRGVSSVRFAYGTAGIQITNSEQRDVPPVGRFAADSAT